VRSVADYLPDWGSVDSAPEGLAVARSAWLAPLILATVGGCLVVSLAWNQPLARAYVQVLDVFGRSTPSDPSPSLGFRPFLGVVIVLLSAAVPGGLGDRIRIAVGALAWYAVVVIALDAAMLNGGSLHVPYPFSVTGNVAVAIAGVAVLTRSVFRWRALPKPVHAPPREGPPVLNSVEMLLALGFAALLVLGITQHGDRYLQTLRDHAALGGIGPGVMLLIPFSWMCLFVLARATRATRPRPSTPRQGPPFSVGFLVPAYNEEKVSAAGDARIAAAPRQYPGICRIYVVDNRSSDATALVAEQAIANCRAATGRVLSCLTPGKAHALNLGLAHIREDITVRVDADTVVAPSLVRQLVPHFADAMVGAVGGLTLPYHNRTLIDRMRAIEVFENAGFKRVAQAGVDAVVVVPGIMAAYRTWVLRELEGFGTGFNGEDADVIIRIGRTGLRVVQDPSIVVRSEVPRTLRHLREQRLRWSRSLYHVAARNAPGARPNQGPRGFVYLPMMLLYGSRKALIPPIFVFGIVLLATNSTVVDVRNGAALGAMLVGASMLLTIFTLAIYRQFGLLPYAPAYPVFRLFRAYVAMEALLTLPPRKRGSRAGGREPVPSSSPYTARRPPACVGDVAAMREATPGPAHDVLTLLVLCYVAAVAAPRRNDGGDQDGGGLPRVDGAEIHNWEAGCEFAAGRQRWARMAAVATAAVLLGKLASAVAVRSQRVSS
jgi:cellulose synthase/poly-beta-1,6-N-acetylglucosamine synthase-like glycosyltransferase